MHTAPDKGKSGTQNKYFKGIISLICLYVEANNSTA